MTKLGLITLHYFKFRSLPFGQSLNKVLSTSSPSQNPLTYRRPINNSGYLPLAQILHHVLGQRLGERIRIRQRLYKLAGENIQGVAVHLLRQLNAAPPIRVCRIDHLLDHLLVGVAVGRGDVDEGRFVLHFQGESRDFPRAPRVHYYGVGQVVVEAHGGCPVEDDVHFLDEGLSVLVAETWFFGICCDFFGLFRDGALPKLRRVTSP